MVLKEGGREGRRKERKEGREGGEGREKSFCIETLQARAARGRE
jgi:hypothetical protein